MLTFLNNNVNRHPIIRTWAGTLRLIQKSDLDPPKEAKTSDTADLAKELIAADTEDKVTETPKTKQDQKKRPANTPPNSAEKLAARKRVNSL